MEVYDCIIHASSRVSNLLLLHFLFISFQLIIYIHQEGVLRQLFRQPSLHPSVISSDHFPIALCLSLLRPRVRPNGPPFPLPAALLRTCAGLKSTRQGEIIRQAPLQAKLNTALAVCSPVCGRLLQPGDNCIAVSPWLMSCQCNCFTV